MSATLVGGQRRYTPRVWTSTSDPTNASKASTGYLVGDVWLNTATLNEFTLVDQTNGVWRHKPRIVAQSFANNSHTGDTSETALATIALAGGLLGTAGVLELITHWQLTNNANAKTAKLYLGASGAGLSGTNFLSWSLPNFAQAKDHRSIGNNASQSAQRFLTAGFGGGGWAAAGGSTLGSAAIDTSAAFEIVASGTLASGSDTITLAGYSLKLYRPDIT